LVTIINNKDSAGGAANAAYRLHQGFDTIGIDSFMLVKDKKTQNNRVLQIKPLENKSSSRDLDNINAFQHQYINQNRTPLTNTKFTFSYPGYDLSGLEIIKQADIINLHFITSFLSIETVRELLHLGKPVVWTLHDQWAFTGGCHYSAGCEKYKTDCIKCPQLMNDPHNLPNKVLTSKLSLIDKSKLFIITPSKWLSRVARESFLFKGLTIETISNSIETDIFCPVGDKGESKKKYNIPNDVINILFGAPSGNIKRKGFDKLLEALETCCKNRKFRKLVKRKKINLLCFGTPSADIEKLNIPYISFGKITDDYELRDIYNASDFFVLPSLEDNLPNTMLESMSCGTPLVAFNIGGMPDVITDNETGRLVPPFDTGKFAESIVDLILNEKKRKKLGLNSRKLIENNYKLKDQAQKYDELFLKLLPKGHSSSAYKNLDYKKIQYCPIDFSLHSELMPIIKYMMII
jgi:glycosyltransferase involved in cell wall biosynthesis